MSLEMELKGFQNNFLNVPFHFMRCVLQGEETKNNCQHAKVGLHMQVQSETKQQDTKTILLKPQNVTMEPTADCWTAPCIHQDNEAIQFGSRWAKKPLISRKNRLNVKQIDNLFNL